MHKYFASRFCKKNVHFFQNCLKSPPSVAPFLASSYQTPLIPPLFTPILYIPPPNT